MSSVNDSSMAETDQDISDDLKTNDELLDEIVEHQEAKLSNLQNKHEYELQQNQRRLEEYERTIRELQEKLQVTDEKTSANLRQFDEEGGRFDKEEKEKLSRLHQRLRDDQRTLVDTHHNKVLLEEQNTRLLNDLRDTRQMVASMKKGLGSGDKADGTGAQELIKSLEMKLNMKTAESEKLKDKLEELRQRIESLQKESQNKEIASNEATEQTADSEEAEGQINHPINSGEITKWLKEGVVELKIKRINMLGPPGSGKTCSLRLLLNEDPPEEDVTDSTPIACRAVKATRISCSKGAWERIGSEALLEKLASDLAAYVGKHPKPVDSLHNNQQQGELMECKSSEATDAPDSTDSQNSCYTKILEAIKSGEKIHLNQSWVYIVDSGGQPAFQELLPLFVRRASLNIVTLDLSQGLDQRLECNFRIRGELFPIDSFFASNREFFKKVVCSGDMCPSNKPLPQEAQCDAQPMHFILGTHFDKVSHEEFKEVNDALTVDLSKSSSEDQVYYYKENESEMICHVNTLIPKGEERSQVSQEISKFIYNCVSRKLKIPIRWFAFDLFLQMEAKNKNSSYLKIQDVLSTGERLKMNKDDTEKALEYLHEVTIILYYPQVLPDIVFVDPCTIHDTLTRLLSLTYVNRSSYHLILKEDEEISKQEVKDLSKKGLFTLDLFEKLPDIPGILKSDLTELLCQLHIIAKIGEKSYFIPSALSCYNGPPLTKDNIKPLVIVWLNQDNKNLPVPQGIFCSVIVQLINEAALKFSMPGSPSEGSFIYRNAMSFQILIENEGCVGTLHFINKYKHIELYFTGDDPAKYCPLVREIVMKAIAESSKKIRVDEGKPVPAFECPETEDCYCLVIDEEDERSHCTFPKSAEVIKGQESYWNWFHAPRHNNSEVCHTHLNIWQLDEIYCTLTNALFSTSEWENLGYKLGLIQPIISTIRSDRQTSDERLREVLTKWLQQAASAATWPLLLKALEEANRKDVAEKIRCKIQATAK
ncbi:PREDICTED: uncharacterized protein LOC109584222 [Amphimedon queenslandica]|uniref:Death domain-containing protein n=1 Tax=Amphimedon queenslandica TaxID=400682 RepID=A0A1X7U962_AMPQE|nr:PREDICTED: uncharacterized protein LOC109584222 [Amphimedon queenslandica]|eukprot:XP_019855440.1 PREDICTED: uncharacterized protein LOC109584222 [Amphimedon queenslandica]